MEDSAHFVPATLTLCQWCEFKCGHSISFTTQSLPKPDTDVRIDDSYRIDDPFAPPFSIQYTDRRQAEPEYCPADEIFPPLVSHIATHETRNHRTYISTPSPPQKNYSTIKESLQRADYECAEANNIVFLSSNLHQVKASVIFRRFQIKDREARGETRRALLMMIMSDRFASLEYISHLHPMFGEVIRVLCEKSQAIYDSESPSVRQPDGLRPLRSLGTLLKFSDLHTFLHQKFTRILYSLETQFLPLTIVPPGKLDEMSKQEVQSCFCQPPESPDSYARERAETLVEPPSPKFTSITEFNDLLKGSDLKLVIQNVVIGNQVVVRGQHPATVDSILALLSTFLPPQCVFNFGYSQHYEPCYACRFLGLPLTVHVPTSGQILVLDVMAAVERPREIKSFGIEVRRCAELHKLLVPLPKIVDEITELINNFKSHSYEAETYSTALKAIVQNWASKSISYFLAVKSMIDASSAEAKLLSILQAHENDVLVLKFFKGALKHHEKNKLLNEVQ